MSSKPKFWERLEANNPSKEEDLCNYIREHAVDILAGLELPETIQTHRESCFTCLRHLSETLTTIKKEVPSSSSKGLIYLSNLSFAAGTAEGLRTLSESNLSKAGLSAGWHIDISNKNEQELKISLICDVPKEVKMTLYNQDHLELITLHLSQLPTYLKKSISENTVKVLIQELPA